MAPVRDVVTTHSVTCSTPETPSTVAWQPGAIRGARLRTTRTLIYLPYLIGPTIFCPTTYVAYGIRTITTASTSSWPADLRWTARTINLQDLVSSIQRLSVDWVGKHFAWWICFHFCGEYWKRIIEISWVNKLAKTIRQPAALNVQKWMYDTPLSAPQPSHKSAVSAARHMCGEINVFST